MEHKLNLLLALVVVWSVPHDSDGQVLFSASLRGNQDAISIDDPLRYGEIDVNQGRAFDGTFFTAPSDGVYLFMFSGKSDDVTLHLKVNNVIRSSAIVRDTVSTNEDNMASNSIVLFLNANDIVAVYLAASSKGIRNVQQGDFPSFVGARLYTTTTDVVAFSGTRTWESADVAVDTRIYFNEQNTTAKANFVGTIFYVPEDGLYLFTFSAKGNNFVAHLVVNDTIKYRSVVHHNDDGLTENSRSNSVVLYLTTGTNVTIFQGAEGGALNNTSPNGGVFTQFSGVLLSGGVGFSAALTVNKENPTIVDEAIEFNLIQTNVGGGLESPDTFQPPTDGYYLFTFTGKSSEMEVHLKHRLLTRDEIQRSAICNVNNDANLPGQHDNMAHNAAILRLNLNERIQVTLNPYGEVGLINEPNPEGGATGNFTQFSGFFLDPL